MPTSVSLAILETETTYTTKIKIFQKGTKVDSKRTK